jgi:hypothetical protein
VIKPKVFLSHSKADVEFVRKIDSHLRRCLIETWLDEIDIQHGDSWLRSIFDEGISKSDFVLVLISEHSLLSPMVDKEIDAGILSQLKSNSVKFLPYVTNPDLRNKLRLDLQTTQMPVLNIDVYDDIFPVIVAQIWNHFANKTISTALKEKDLEIENFRLTSELDKVKGSFLSEYDAKFEFIYENLNYLAEFTLKYSDASTGLIQGKTYSINFLYVLQVLYENLSGQIANHLAHEVIFQNLINDALGLKIQSWEFSDDIVKTLLLYGFLTRNYNPNTQGDNSKIRSFFVSHNYEIYMYSELLDKFILWLGWKKMHVARDVVLLT